MADKVVCTISKRKEVTEGPIYQMFKKVLAESCKPCPYFKTIQALKIALVDDALEKKKGNQSQAAAYLGIHRNNVRYIQKKMPKGESAQKIPVSPTSKVDRMYQLMAIMEREKKAAMRA